MDENWIFSLQKTFQREGTDEPPVYFHEKRQFDPTTLHVLEQYRAVVFRDDVPAAQSAEAFERVRFYLGRELHDMVIRFLNAERMVQSGELTVAADQ